MNSTIFFNYNDIKNNVDKHDFEMTWFRLDVHNNDGTSLFMSVSQNASYEIIKAGSMCLCD